MKRGPHLHQVLFIDVLSYNYNILFRASGNKKSVPKLQLVTSPPVEPRVSILRRGKVDPSGVVHWFMLRVNGKKLRPTAWLRKKYMYTQFELEKISMKICEQTERELKGNILLGLLRFGNGINLWRHEKTCKYCM